MKSPHTTATQPPPPNNPNQPNPYQLHDQQLSQRIPLSTASSKASLRLPLHAEPTLANAIAASTLTHPITSTPPASAAAPSAARLDSSADQPSAGQPQHPHPHHYHHHPHHPHHAPHLQHQSAIVPSAGDSPPTDATATPSKPIKRNSSLISFKSIDFTLKNIYTNMKHKSRDAAGATTTGSASGGSTGTATSSSKTSIAARTPYVRVETVDYDASQENLLLSSYQQSPYGQQARRSFDRSPSGSSQYLTAGGGGGRYGEYVPPSRSPSPSAFLTITQPPNVRRSSTSDICENRQRMPAATTAAAPGDAAMLSVAAAPVGAAARRPSTSDLLRRARERKGGPGEVAGKIGRSVSQGGIPRGGRGGGRRTSIAF